MYVGASRGNTLWRTFDTFITLSMVFCQQGDDPSQIHFRQLLLNLRNATPTIADWTLLMSRTSSSLSQTENRVFDQSTHLFSTNNSVALHNKQMLKQLNVPIALCSVEVRKQTLLLSPEDEQLDMVVLLAFGQQVMLTTNLWVEAGLVNGALGQVVSIFYNTTTTPPMLPLFVVVDFVNYKG